MIRFSVDSGDTLPAGPSGPREQDRAPHRLLPDGNTSCCVRGGPNQTQMGVHGLRPASAPAMTGLCHVTDLNSYFPQSFNLIKKASNRMINAGAGDFYAHLRCQLS